VGLLASIRSAAADVAAVARHVHIESKGIARVAASLAAEAAEARLGDPAHEPFADASTTLAYVFTVDAVNFGSGWFPVLDKLPGRSGYMTISTHLRAHFERRGPWSPADLQKLDGTECARVFGQRSENEEALELMALFARSLSDLGHFLERKGMSGFEDLVAAADRSAERMVELLAEMPFYHDVAHYHGREVPLYKRAQITPADLSLAFDGRGPGHFTDLDALTMFADNLVPHVLRCEGALHYEPALLAQIEAGNLLPPNSEEEVEIRAVGLHAVEQIVAYLSHTKAPLPARRVDQLLWSRGQSPEIKRHNRHRTRSVYY